MVDVRALVALLLSMCAQVAVELPAKVAFDSEEHHGSDHETETD